MNILITEKEFHEYKTLQKQLSQLQQENQKLNDGINQSNLAKINALLKLEKLQQENEQLKADYGNKAQVERDILIQENIDLKQKMIRILENIDVSYNDWKKWKDELKESDKSETN